MFRCYQDPMLRHSSCVQMWPLLCRLVHAVPAFRYPWTIDVRQLTSQKRKCYRLQALHSFKNLYHPSAVRLCRLEGLLRASADLCSLSAFLKNDMVKSRTNFGKCWWLLLNVYWYRNLGDSSTQSLVSSFVAGPVILSGFQAALTPAARSCSILSSSSWDSKADSGPRNSRQHNLRGRE